jgi:hypothetical protein
MKKYFATIMIAVLAIACGAQEDFTRSRNLSKFQPVSGYYLGTDGRWNIWKIFSATGASTFNMQTGAITAATTITPQAPSAVTPTITVTAQRPGAQTPTITVTPLAPATVTPTITVTKEVGAVTASGANSLVTFTNYFNPVTETVSMTDTNGVTALMVTNITWSTADYTMATNGVVAVTVTGGGAVMTNATAASSALPDFITNATAVSSALLDYPTNATAACSALPLFATNATAATAITGGGAVVTNGTITTTVTIP